MQTDSPRRGGELDTPPAPALKLSISDDGPPAGRYAVPRDATEVPPALARKWAESRGADQRREIRRLYRAELMASLDACLAVDARSAAKLFGLSERAWRRLDVTGQVPRPTRIGPKLVRWRLRELAAWVRRGCPDRETWDAMRRRAP